MRTKKFAIGNIVISIRYDETNKDYQFEETRKSIFFDEILEIDRKLFQDIKEQVENLSCIYRPKEIMTPNHELWNLFTSKLLHNLGHYEGIIARRCSSTIERPKTTKILKEMNTHLLMNIDIEKSLQHMLEKGGCCDCEVVLNVTK